MSTFRFVRRVDIAIENVEQVRAQLERFGLSMVELLGQVDALAVNGDCEALYVYASDPKQSVVGAPGFLIDTDEYEESDPVYGPIHWSARAIDSYIEDPNLKGGTTMRGKVWVSVGALVFCRTEVNGEPALGASTGVGQAAISPEQALQLAQALTDWVEEVRNSGAYPAS